MGGADLGSRLPTCILCIIYNHGMTRIGYIHTGAKFTWKTTWEAFMRELAPQDTKGAYTRPKNAFADSISDAPGAKFPVRASVSFRFGRG